MKIVTIILLWLWGMIGLIGALSGIWEIMALFYGLGMVAFLAVTTYFIWSE